MAELYFRVDAEYEKVARLRQEINKLTAYVKTLNSATDIRQIETAQRTLDNLNKEFERSVKDASATAGEITKAGEAMETMNGISAKFIATIGGLSVLKGLAGQMVQTRGEFQQLEIAFGTMLKSADKAKALMDELTQTAAHTPFDLQGIAGAAKQLLAYGSSAEKVNSELVMLGNVAAGVGSSIGDIAYLYGTLRTQGRAYMMDIRQFAGRGIPIYEELSKVLGVSKDEINKLVSAGKVGFPEIEKAFISMTAEGGKFYNLMAEQSKSLTGQISNLQDAWDMMMNEMGKSTEGIAGTVISSLASMVENYDKVLKIISSLVVAYGVMKTAIIVNTLMQGKELVVSKALSAQFLALAKRGIVLSSSEKALAVATGGLSLKFKALWAVLRANPIGVVLTALTMVAGAIWAFSDNIDETTEAVSEFEDRTDKVTGKLNIWRKTLDSTEKGGVVYKQTLGKINDLCRQYGVTLLEENDTVEQQKSKYESLAEAIRATNAEKLKISIQESALEKRNAGISKLQEELTKNFKEVKVGYAVNSTERDVTEIQKQAETWANIFVSTAATALSEVEGQGEEAANKALDKWWRQMREVLKKSLPTATDQEIEQILNYNKAVENMARGIKEQNAVYDQALDVGSKVEKENRKGIEALHDRQEAQRLNTLSTKELNNELERMRREFANIGIHIKIRADFQLSDADRKQYESITKGGLANNIVGLERALERIKKNPKLSSYSLVMNGGKVSFKGSQQELIQQITDEYQRQAMLLGERTDKETNAGDAYKKALSTYNSTKKSYDEALKEVKEGNTKYTTKDLKELKENYETAEKALKDYGGAPKETGKRGGSRGKQFDVRRAQYDIEKIDEQFTKSIEAYNKKAQDLLAEGRLDAMKDGTQKDIERIRAQSQKEIAAYDAEIDKFVEEMKKNDLSKWLKGGADRKEYDYKATKSDSEYRSDLFAQNPLLKSNYDKMIAQANEKRLKAEKEAQELELKADYDYIIRYGTLLEKKEALEKQYELNKGRATSQRERNELAKEYEKSLSDLRLEILKSDESYIDAFDNLAEVSDRTLQNLITKFEDAKDSQKDLKPTELKEYVDTIRQMRDELENRNPFKALKDSISAERKARTEYRQVKGQYERTGSIYTGNVVKGEKGDYVPEVLSGAEAIAYLTKVENRWIKSTVKVRTNLQKTASAVGKLSSAIQACGDEVGGMTGEIISMIGEIGMVVTSAIDSFSNVSKTASAAIQTVEKASIILTVISTAFQIANKIIGMFDSGKQKKIENIQGKVDKLTRAYNKLEKAVDKAYSKNARQLIQQEEENLKLQRILIQQQLELEKSKKKTDKDKVSDYENKLEDITEQLRDLRDAEVDAIFGQDVKTAIESFADAYVTAWENGENRIRSSKNFVKDMIKSMITEAMKADISAPMERIRAMLNGYFSDNVITKAEEAEVAAYASQVTKELDEKYAWASKYLKDTNDTTEGKGMASMSESTAEELNGRFTALQISGERISGENVVQTKTLSLLNMRVEDIERILTRQQDISDEMRTQLANIYLELKGINENTLAVVKPITSMSKRMEKWDNKIMSL